MPPNKGGNAKKEGGRAKKAENEAKKAAEAERAKESKEADKWKSGAKGSSKGDAAAAKAAELAAKKAERAAMLAAEEASLPSKAKAAPKAGGKGAPAIKTNAGAAAFRTDDPLGLRRDADRVVPELSAVGIEGMLEALEVVNEKTTDEALGLKAGLIERHPERRFKAAFAEYLDREMPKLKEEHPGLRKNQMQDLLYKKFQKAPENPFNQVSVAYNASKEERLGSLKATMSAREDKYRVDQE